MQDNGVPPRLARSSAQSLATMLSFLGIASLSVLFAASLLIISLVANRPENQPRPDLPRLPSGLIASTILILLSSGALHSALLAARRDRPSSVQASMVATLLLALAFLGNQVANWLQLHAAGLGLQGVHEGGFYFLTGLHAAHVLGGLIPMAFVTAAAFRGFYTRTAHHGLFLLGVYWHFLAAVWIALFVFLQR